MKIQTNLPLPVIKALRKLGQDISEVPRRRDFSLTSMGIMSYI